ncbi:MAG: hypothetical protein IJN25_06645 [Clostridia bacterium]|nr:hypothetical protein [Clostridia bacterium]
MRKIKSILALVLCFLLWQLLRIFLPGLDFHPGFAYIYAIIEMREAVEKTKLFGMRRIRATFVGLCVGLLFIALEGMIIPVIGNDILRILTELLLICAGVLLTLTMAQMIKCANFCGVAAIIFVICLVWHVDENRYLYAVTRTLQTMLGVFTAWLVNSGIRPVTENKEKSN